MFHTVYSGGFHSKRELNLSSQLSRRQYNEIKSFVKTLRMSNNTKLKMMTEIFCGTLILTKNCQANFIWCLGLI